MNLKKIHFLLAGITALALSSSQVLAKPAELCGYIANTDSGKIAVVTKKHFVGGGAQMLAHCQSIREEIKNKINSDIMLSTVNWEDWEKIELVSCKKSGVLFGTDKNNICKSKMRKDRYYIVKVTSATNIIYRGIRL